MRFNRLIKLIALMSLLCAQGAMADTVGINFETTSPGITTYGTIANSVAVPGTYNYGHSVPNTPGSVTGTTFGFYDDYIFTVDAGQLDSITSTIDMGGLLGISNLQVRLFNVVDASSPGTTGVPGSLVQSWSNAISCGAGCTGTVDVITPHIVGAGTYDLQVRGTAEALGGSYAGVLNTSAVPLPAALPLLLSGLGLLGGAIRRRVA